MADDLQIFSEYIKECGGVVYQVGSSIWFTHYPQRKWYYLSLSFWEPVTPSLQEIDTVFRESSAYVLRIPGHPSTNYGNPSHLLVASGAYDLSSLNSKARNQTRRGLENCSVTPISFDYLARAGYSAILDTAQRQGVYSQDSMSFKHDCELKAKYSCWSAWGALCDGKLAAFLVALNFQDKIVIMLQRSKTEYLPLNPNNALVYKFTAHALNEKKVRAVSFGMGAIEGDDSQDHFKLGMGYKKVPISDIVVFRPPYNKVVQFLPSKLLFFLSTWANRNKNRNWNKVLSLLKLAKCSIGFQK